MQSIHKAWKARESATARYVIIDGDPTRSRPLGGHGCHAADRIAARVLATSLDRKLAAGCPPESAWLLAVRAREIVQLASRRRLAGYWERVLRIAGSGKEPALAIPLSRARVRAVEPDIRELARLLRVSLPVSARGVAMARLLLTDGGGPLYRGDPQAFLRDQLHAAIAWLDPELPLVAEAAFAAGP